MQFFKFPGRDTVSTLLTKAFGTSIIKVTNIGGTAKSNEPSVRKFTFKVNIEAFESSEYLSGEGSEKFEERMTKTSPCVLKPSELFMPSNSKEFKISLVPYIAMESFNHEYLIVEVKKGKKRIYK